MERGLISLLVVSWPAPGMSEVKCVLLWMKESGWLLRALIVGGLILSSWRRKATVLSGGGGCAVSAAVPQDVFVMSLVCCLSRATLYLVECAVFYTSTPLHAGATSYLLTVWLPHVSMPVWRTWAMLIHIFRYTSRVCDTPEPRQTEEHRTFHHPDEQRTPFREQRNARFILKLQRTPSFFILRVCPPPPHQVRLHQHGATPSPARINVRTVARPVRPKRRQRRRRKKRGH